MERLFGLIDIDQNGFVSAAELSQVHDDGDGLFDAIAASGEETISLDSFRDFFVKLVHSKGGVAASGCCGVRAVVWSLWCVV